MECVGDTRGVKVRQLNTSKQQAADEKASLQAGIAYGPFIPDDLASHWTKTGHELNPRNEA